MYVGRKAVFIVFMLLPYAGDILFMEYNTIGAFAIAFYCNQTWAFYF